MKLTIVLTVFNKRPFLYRAFQSLLSQEHVCEGEYEILAVNDGSTDGSSDVIEEFANYDKRVRVLTQKNQGLSMARNNGTEEAKGDYVWYVDADDVYSPNSVRLICDAMKNSPDIIPIYAKTEGEDCIRNEVPVSAQTGKDILLSLKWESCGVFNVFKKDFLKENNLSFLPGIYHEDAEFTPRMLYAAKTVKVVPEVLYTVIHEPNSITQVPRVQRAFDYLVVADNLNHFVEERSEVGSHIGRVFDYKISMIINNAFSVIAENSKEEQGRFNKEFKNKTQLLRPLKSSHVMKYKLEALLFGLFPRRCVEIYKVLKILR